MGKVYGYIRIDPKESNHDIEIEKQTKIIRSNYVGFTFEFIYDVHSGEDFDRHAWKELKDKVNPGERISVVSLEILSNATLHTTVKEIETIQSRGISVDIVEFQNKGWIHIFTDMHGYFERIRLQRQMAAIATIAKNEPLRKLKYPGRKTILNDIFLQQVQELINQHITSPTELCRKLGRSRSTIYKALKLLNQEDPKSSKNERIV